MEPEGLEVSSVQFFKRKKEAVVVLVRITTLSLAELVGAAVTLDQVVPATRLVRNSSE